MVMWRAEKVKDPGISLLDPVTVSSSCETVVSRTSQLGSNVAASSDGNHFGSANSYVAKAGVIGATEALAGFVAFHPRLTYILPTEIWAPQRTRKDSPGPARTVSLTAVNRDRSVENEGNNTRLDVSGRMTRRIRLFPVIVVVTFSLKMRVEARLKVLLDL